MEEQIPTKCPLNPGLECVDCRMKDYASDGCILFGIRNALLIIGQELHAMRTHSKTEDPIAEAAFTIQSKLVNTAALEYGRCREAETIGGMDF